MEAYNNRGLAYFNKNEYDLAIKNCNEAIKLNPNYTKAYINRANSYNKKKEYNLAIKDCAKAIDINPNYAEAYNNRGFAYNGKKEHNLAIKDCAKAIELDENYADAYINRGLTYNNIKEHSLAIKDFTKAIDINPNRPEPYINRSFAYNERKEYDLVIEDCDKAIDINPNYAEAYNNRGLAYFNKNEYDLAIKNFDKAIEINPNLTEPYNNKAVVIIRLDENKKTKKLDKEWTKEDNDHYIKWLEVCINNNVVDYITSMNIYQLRDLLLKQNDKTLITKVQEDTNKYIKTIVEFKHDKNEEEIKKYYKNNEKKEKVLIRDKDGKIILYQYSSYNDKAICKIKNGQMYFSDPLTFNDPFDPLIRVLNKKHSKRLVELLNFRVSCLSPEIDNLLLWSHYANKHQGICIAYDITELVEQENVIFRQIEYRDKFPKPLDGLMLALSNTSSKSNENKTLINTFTQKQTVWSYEKEYRLILQLKIDKEEEFLPLVDIKAIYLGRDILKEHEKSIKTMIEDMNKGVNLFKMQTGSIDIFKLEAKKYNFTKN